MLLFLAPLVWTHCFAVTFLSPFCLLLRPILKFWSVVGASLMRFTSANVSERRISVSNFGVTRNNFREFNTLDWFQDWWQLRRLHILNTQPNCRVLDEVHTTNTWPCEWRVTAKQRVAPFYHATNTSSSRLLHFCHHSFWTFLWGCSSTWRCAYEHFSPNLQSLMVLWNKHSGGCHFSQKELLQVPLR